MPMIHGQVHTSNGHVLVDLVKHSETNMLFSGTTGMEKIKLTVMPICVQTILVTVSPNKNSTNVISTILIVDKNNFRIKMSQYMGWSNGWI